MDTIEKAAVEYLNRQSRTTHPDGDTDNGGRWRPAETERRACCANIRRPSREWPWSLMVHCRTAEHVACLFGVEKVAVLRMAKKIKTQQ